MALLHVAVRERSTTRRPSRVEPVVRRVLSTTGTRSHARERRLDMTAPTRVPPDFATLDRHITDALAVLRLARAVSTRSRNPESIRAEEHAESQLNGLLDCRHAAQRR